MNNDNFMVFVYNAIIALFAFFVAAPMLLNAISLFTVQKRFAKVMVKRLMALSKIGRAHV